MLSTIKAKHNYSFQSHRFFITIYTSNEQRYPHLIKPPSFNINTINHPKTNKYTNPHNNFKLKRKNTLNPFLKKKAPLSNLVSQINWLISQNILTPRYYATSQKSQQLKIKKIIKKCLQSRFLTKVIIQVNPQNQ